MLKSNPPLPLPLLWCDLCAPRLRDQLLELLRPLGLYLSACLAAFYGIGWLCWGFLLFAHIAALRIAHGAVHRSLGLPKGANRAVMVSVSALLGTSCQALEFTHKIHHARCGAPDDLEGQLAHCSFFKACLISPTYHLRVIRAAWRNGGALWRGRIMVDLACAVIAHLSLALWLEERVVWLWFGLLVLNSASGVLAVWLFHRGELGTRSARLAWLNWLAMGMLYHAEHHRYPAVPTARLGELAVRMQVCGVQHPPLIDIRVVRKLLGLFNWRVFLRPFSRRWSAAFTTAGGEL